MVGRAELGRVSGVALAMGPSRYSTTRMRSIANGSASGSGCSCTDAPRWYSEMEGVTLALVSLHNLYGARDVLRARRRAGGCNQQQDRHEDARARKP